MRIELLNRKLKFIFSFEFCWHKWKTIQTDPNLTELCIKCVNVIDIGNRQFYGGKWRIKEYKKQ